MKAITEKNPQYQMPTLSGEDKENLISNIKSLIEQITSDCDMGWTSGIEYLLPLQIALASLTAECEFFQWKWVRDESAIWTTTPIDKLGAAVSSFGKEGENVSYRLLYTSPPVPVIKLPSDAMIKEVFLANGFKEKEQPDGEYDLNPYVYSAAAALIKKLSGLGD